MKSEKSPSIPERNDLEVYNMGFKKGREQTLLEVEKIVIANCNCGNKDCKILKEIKNLSQGQNLNSDGVKKTMSPTSLNEDKTPDTKNQGCGKMLELDKNSNINDVDCGGKCKWCRKIHLCEDCKKEVGE